MIRYDPTLVDLTSNFFVLHTNVKVCLYNYSYWVELSMNIHEGKGYGLQIFRVVLGTRDFISIISSSNYREIDMKIYTPK